MSGRRVLFVDDDPILRSVVQIALRRAGHEVLTCAGADEAVEAVRGSAFACHVAVLDVRLGGNRDGFALAVELLALRPELPVMLVSGAADKLQHERALSMGLLGVFPKAQALASLELLLPPQTQ